MIPDTNQHWYIAYVKSCQERRCEEILNKMGVECYLPKQREVHKWSDRKKIVVRLILPHMIFVHVNERTRRDLLKEIYGICAYMMDRTSNKVAIVRDSDMEAFRMMVEHSEEPVRMSSEPLAKGDKVRVLTGPLKGMEYELANVQGRKCIAIRLDILGSAIVEFDQNNLEKIG